MSLPQFKIPIINKHFRVFTLIMVSSALLISYQNCGKQNTSSQDYSQTHSDDPTQDRSQRLRLELESRRVHESNREAIKSSGSTRLQDTNEQGVCPSNATDRATIQTIADSLRTQWVSAYYTGDGEPHHSGWFSNEAGHFKCDTSGVRIVELSIYEPVDTSIIGRLTALLHLDIPELDDSGLRNLSTLIQLKTFSSYKREQGQISDISPISSFSQLEFLDLSNHQIRDISALRNLTQLKEIQLRNNQITNVEPLSNLTQLRFLALSLNRIESIRGLSRLLNLEQLFLSKNNISDASDLSQLTRLKHLSLSINNLTNISFLSGLSQIESFDAQENNIQNIPSNLNLPNLNKIYLGKNNIQNLQPLTSLQGLSTLYLSDNKIRDLSALSSMQRLQDINLANNRIENILPIGSLTSLEYLDLSHNNISNIGTVFRGLANLFHLDLSNNRLTGQFSRAVFPEVLYTSQGYYFRYNLNNNFFCGFPPENSRVFTFEGNTRSDNCYTQERPHVRVAGIISLPADYAPLDITTGTRMVASVANLRANNAQGCAEVGESTHCQGPNAQFTDFPNTDWSYDGTLWNSQMLIPREWAGLTVRMYFKNKTNGLVSEPFRVIFKNP